jgi:hypothetical protein
VRRCCVLLLPLLLQAEDPELGRIEIAPPDARLSIDSNRPVDSAAKTLATDYGISISSEDPVSIDAANQRFGLEAHFAVNPQGFLQSVRAALETVVNAANAKLPYTFRLEQDGDDWTFVPVPALLDRHVTIPPGRRRVNEHVKLLTDALSAQTGFHVSCCQGAIAGYPWGMETIDFAAYDEPARSVLRRLIRATPGRHYYLQRCSTVTVPWCFINLKTLH